jgi:DNA-binding SARP family transcriptional activator
MTAEFRLLGNVELRISDRPVDVGHARQRCVLAALLIEANRVVSVDQLVNRAWGEQRLPARPSSAVQTYVSLLRRVIAAAGDMTIVRQASGYKAVVDEGAIDMHPLPALIHLG